MRYLILLFILVVTTTLHADTIHPTHLEKTLGKVVEIMSLGDLDGVKEYHNSLLPHFKSEDNIIEWMEATKKIAVILDTFGFPMEAIDILAKANLNHIWRKPANKEEWDYLATIYTNLAYIYYESLEDYRNARKAYQQALNIFENKVFLEDDYVGAYVISPLGNLNSKLGDFIAAEVLIQRFKRIGIKFENEELIADACSDLGILYLNNGELEKGIEICEEGLSLPNLNPRNKGLLQVNYSRLLKATGKVDLAKQYAEMAFANFGIILYEWKDSIGAYNRSHVTSFLAEIESDAGNYEKAKENLSQAFSYLQEYYQTAYNRDFAKHYCLEAQIHYSWKNYELALSSAQKAIKSVLENFKSENDLQNPPVEMLYAENALQEALSHKAEALASLAEQNKNVELYKKALECHELIFEVEKQLRRSQSYETSKLYIIEESRERSERAIEMAMKVWEWTRDDQYKEKALAFAERSKSILLLEAFNQVEAAQLANIPDSLLAEEKLYKARISLLEKKIFEYGDEEGRLETELLQLRQAYNTWITQLEETYPSYYDLKYNFETLSSEEIRQQLIGNEHAYLEYFVGQNNIYAFYITQDAFEVIEIQKDFPLEDWVSTFRKDIEAFQFPNADRQKLLTSYNHLALQLYNKLLKPISNLPKQLTIIPSGILGYLPFEALITAQPQKIRDFKSYAYLINDHVIHYAYSISLQKSLMERKSSGHAYAGFAPAFTGGANFSSLDYNQSAVQEVAKTLRGKAILGQEASKNAFTNQAGDYQLIQLATHAIANTEEGDFSYIVFADETDGYDSLFVKDVYLLDLSADLVMLSACETAVGKLFQGEGFINLARAFFYAGSKSVVTTLWSINEEANEKITTAFYQCLKTGASKSEALRTAKLKYLEQSEAHYAHPVYWAAFTPIGNMEAVYSSFNYTWIVLGGLVGLVLLGVFGRKFVLIIS